MARLARLVLLLLVLLSGCDGYDPDKTAAYLADLGITGYQLEPSFSSSTFDYVATIPPGTDSITVEVTSVHQGATVTVNGALVESDGGSIALQLAGVTNTIKVVVLSPDKMRIRTYTVIVSKQLLSYAVGGTVSGLTGTVTLQNNAGDDLAIAADGAFEFATPVTDGDEYTVTVSTQPDGQVCSITNGTGTIDSADVTDVAVDCVDLVAGLFIDDLVEGLAYSCSSGSWNETTAAGEFSCPQGDQISFWLGSNELGPVSTSSIISPYNLFPEDSLAALNLARLLQSLDSDLLPDNGFIVIDDALVALLPQTLDFSLDDPEFEAAMTSYGITLVSAEVAEQNLRQAIAQYVPANSAPVAQAGSDLAVGVGSTVTLNGLASSDPDGDALLYRWNFVSRPAGSNAQLVAPLTYGPSFVADVAGSYVVRLLVFDGTVTGMDSVTVTANTGVVVPAAPQGLQAVPGDSSVALSWDAVSGATGYVIYWNTTGNVTTSGNWIGPIASTQANLGSLTNGTTYYYRVAARNASGEGPLSNEASATPTRPTYTVGGTVSGLTGTTTLQNNGGDSLVVNAPGGAFTFSNSIPDGGGYSVTVSSQPVGQTCRVTDPASGTVAGADVTDLEVVCVTHTNTVGGTVSGLTGTVILQNNGADNLEISANGEFTFVTAVAYGGDYLVTVSAQPLGQICSVANGSGVMAGADVSDVGVNCFDSGTPTTSDWKWANPLPQGNDLTDVAWGNGRYVAVGLYGTVLTSDDGLTWSVGDIGVDAWLYAIVWDETRFVAVGGDMTVAGNGNLAISGDGLNWTVQEVGTRYAYSDIAWSGSRYVAVGYQNPDPQLGGANVAVSATSTDGVTWTTQTHAGYSWDDVAWNGSVFAVMERSGLIHTSEDGVNWVTTDMGLTGASLGDIGSDGGQFVVVGSADGVYTSPDGLAWTLQPGTSPVRGSSITWDGSQFVVGGSAAVYTSQDGVTWTGQPPVSTDFEVWNSVISLDAVGGQYFALGNHGVLLNSPDLATWTLRTSGDFTGLWDVTWGDNLFVAVGNDKTVRTSPDGISWTTRASNNPDWALFGVAWGDGWYVAVGGGDSNQALTSTDGLSWSPQTVVEASLTLESVARGAGLFVAVGQNGAVYSSPDGVTWTARTIGISAADSFYDISWNGSLFVAVGYSDVDPYSANYATSQDGITWTPQLLPWDQGAQSIAWNGSLFVAVGHQAILTSFDGLTWTVRSNGMDWLTQVAWTGTQFVATGDVGSATVLTSDDGVTWTSERSISGFYQGVASNGTRTIFVTAWGGIVINDTL